MDLARFRRTVCWSLLIALAYASVGCATIFKGSTDKVNFSSDPTSARVYVNGQYMGDTPFELQLQSKNTYTIEFRKNGHKSKTVVLTNSVGAGWIILDAIFGLIPVIVDAATGNWYSLDQDHVTAALEPQQQQSSSHDDRMTPAGTPPTR